MSPDPNRGGSTGPDRRTLSPSDDPSDSETPPAFFLNQDATAMQGHPPRSNLAHQPGNEPIEQLGPYKILRELGAGGMGIVYEAEDLILGRRVALKVMRTGMPGEDESKKRFLREAQAAAVVTHDHVITIYQVGEDRGIPFLSMQLLIGQTLEDRLHELELH